MHTMHAMQAVLSEGTLWQGRKDALHMQAGGFAGAQSNV